MRFLILSLVGLSVVVALVGCGTERGSQRSAASSEPTPASTATVEDVLVDDASLPGCTAQGQGSFYVNTIARSYDCENGDRLTSTVIFGKSLEEARTAQDNTWGTKDGATDQIRASLRARPVDMASLVVSDVSASFGKLGADQENIWCAVYTDSSGTRRVTEYYGVFRYRTFLVQYTSLTESGGSCEASRALQSVRTLAEAQLRELKAASP